MTGTKNHQDPPTVALGQSKSALEPQADASQRLSPGLFHSLTLIVIGASIGVFWREVFQLTIRAIEAFR